MGCFLCSLCEGNPKRWDILPQSYKMLCVLTLAAKLPSYALPRELSPKPPHCHPRELQFWETVSRAPQVILCGPCWDLRVPAEGVCSLDLGEVLEATGEGATALTPCAVPCGRERVTVSATAWGCMPHRAHSVARPSMPTSLPPSCRWGSLEIRSGQHDTVALTWGPPHLVSYIDI